MSKTTSGRHAAAKAPSLIQRVRAAIARRNAQTEARYAAWAATNTTLKGIS